MHAELRITHADRPTFDLIALQQLRAGPALMVGGNLPTQVHHVADAGVHSEAAQGREKVRRIAGEEHWTGLIALSYEGEAAGPGPAGNDIERHFGAEHVLDYALDVERAPIG